MFDISIITIDEYSEAHHLGYVSDADGGFIRHERLGGLQGGIFNQSPDLAVEVVSPYDKAICVFEKARLYLLAGTGMVWMVFPDNRSIYACTLHSPNRLNVDIYDHTMTTTAGNVLPNFSLALIRNFAQMNSE